MSDFVEAAPRRSWVQRHAAGFVLAVLLGIAGLAWAATVLVQPTPAAPAPPVEPGLVRGEAKDAPAGKTPTGHGLEKSVEPRTISKDALPQATNGLDRESLRNDRADDSKTAAPEEAPLSAPAAQKKWPGLVLPEGTVVATLSVNPSHGAGFIVPGSRIDILATAWLDNRFVTLPVAVDVLVVAVETRQGPAILETHAVSFALTKDQSALLALAKDRGCTLSPVLLAPGKKPERVYDAKKAEALLRELPEPVRRMKGD